MELWTFPLFAYISLFGFIIPKHMHLSIDHNMLAEIIHDVSLGILL